MQYNISSIRHIHSYQNLCLSTPQSAIMFPLEVFALLKQIVDVVDDNARIQTASVNKLSHFLPALCSYKSTMTTMEIINKSPIKRHGLKRSLSPPLSRWETSAANNDSMTMKALSRPVAPTTCTSSSDSQPRQPRRQPGFASTANRGWAMQISIC